MKYALHINTCVVLMVISVCGCDDSVDTAMLPASSGDADARSLIEGQGLADVSDINGSASETETDVVSQGDVKNDVAGAELEAIDADSVDGSTWGDSIVADILLLDIGDDVAEPVDAVPLDADDDATADGEALDDIQEPSIASLCFPGFQPSETLSGPQYDPYSPIVGQHCYGTNHQAIEGLERVVFIGDSVTVGTPNEEYLLSVDNEHFWRNKLAAWLSVEFSLDEGDFISWSVWKGYDYFTGKGAQQSSGDFHNCSKWGARTDDLMSQLQECVPGGSADKTLIAFTMGGNDVAKITQVGAQAEADEVAEGYPEAWALAESSITYLEEAMEWMTDPMHFPNGVYVVFANPFEFTDGTGKTSACTPQSSLNIPGLGEFDLSFLDFGVAELAGYGEWANPDALQAIIVWMLEEYMRIAVEHQVDLVWMMEHFCGHGYVSAGDNADPSSPCYLGPDSEVWFDVTCTHPNAAGHNAIYQFMKATIDE